MSRRFYIMPIIGTGFGEGNERRGKYRDEAIARGYRFTIMDYGPEPWCIARLIPAPTPTDHGLLTADPQVFAIPEDIGDTVSEHAATVATKLEAVNIPGDWVRSDTTWLALLKRLAAYCLLMQRASGLAENYVDRMFEGGRTLDSTIGNLPLNARQRLARAADSFGFNRQGINNNTTFRDALKQIAHQWTKRIRFVEDDL